MYIKKSDVQLSQVIWISMHHVNCKHLQAFILSFILTHISQSARDENYLGFALNDLMDGQFQFFSVWIHLYVCLITPVVFSPNQRSAEDLEVIFEELLHLKAAAHLSASVSPCYWPISPVINILPEFTINIGSTENLFIIILTHDCTVWCFYFIPFWNMYNIKWSRIFFFNHSQYSSCKNNTFQFSYNIFY